MAVLTVLAVSAVVAVSVVTATPLRPNPPEFRHPDKSQKRASWLQGLKRPETIKIDQRNSTERQKRSQILAPVLVILSGNSFGIF